MMADDPQDLLRLADEVNPAQRRLLLKEGRYFSTSQAMSLPLADLVMRAGGYNRWIRTDRGKRLSSVLRARAHSTKDTSNVD